MDESWRMRMGMPNFPRRRSIEETSSSGPTRSSLFNTTTTTTATTTETLDPDDFSDVFGGPPRSVISRKFSGGGGGGEFTTRSTSFYREIFRPSVFVSPANGNGGRSLPAFRIPTRSEGFYGDIFGAEEGGGGGGGWRSRERSRPGSKAVSKSKSKSNSSSVLSSEELSPLRPAIRDDVALSSFASKLRPINVPSRWNSTTMMPEEPFQKHTMPAFPCNHSSYIDNNQYMENDYNDNYNRSFYHGISRRVSSPETISLEPNSYQSVKISVDDLELNSPSTPASSLCQEPEAKVGIHDNTMQEEEEEQEQEEEQEEDEVMSSYVIEITSDHREGAGEAVSIDEAIAWAKEKFQTSSSERTHEKDRSDEMEKRPNVHEFFYQQGDGHGIMHSPPMDEEQKDWTREEEKEQSEAKIEMDLLDEDIRLWSAGKETNIRLLLSTLHHILWPNSGWYAIPLTNLVESSHVKKAYQKARLCLHPDKLQQRGAKVPQKYVAEKAFSILQDAWAAFINQDVFFS